MAARDPYAGIGTSAPAPSWRDDAWPTSNARPATRTRPADMQPGTLEAYVHMWQDIPAERARQLYLDGRRRIETRITNPSLRQRAFAQYNAQPATQALRALGGFQPFSTARQDMAEIAQRSHDARVNFARTSAQDVARRVFGLGDRPRIGNLEIGTDFDDAFFAGAQRGLFGIPERILAGNNGPADIIARARRLASPEGQAAEMVPLDYDERLDAIRAGNDEAMGRSLPGNILGRVATGLVGGGLVAKGVGGVAGLAAESGLPIVARTGNVLQRVMQMERGAGAMGAARNAGRAAIGGGAGGALQAAGEGSNVLEGTAFGAIGGPIFHTAFKGIQNTFRGLRNILGFEPVEQVIGRYVRATPAQIQARMDARARQGLPSSIYEVLPLRDRQALDDAIARMPPRARERVATLVRNRASNMVRETTEQTRRVIAPEADRIRASIAQDLANSRGGAGTAPTPAEIALAHRASRSPLDMEDVADQEARNIMAPHDPVEAYASVDELVPQHPVQRGTTIEMVPDNPEVGAMIRSAAGPLRIADRPVTVRDITAIMSRLSKITARSPDYIERSTAGQAIDHLEGILARDHPDVMPAIQQMRDAYARRMRMIEGVTEGAQTRLRENVDPGNAASSRAARSAYDTAEGSQGRTLGQAAQLERDLLRSPNTSLRNLERVASDPTQQAAISANLGHDAGEEIAAIARTQSQSARRLAGLDREAQAEGGSDAVHVMQNLMMLSPNTLPSTKAFALSRLVGGALRIPERQANSLANMLFSQSPTQISRAIGMLQRMGVPGRSIIRDIATGAFLQSGPNALPDESLPPEVDLVPAEDLPAETAPTEDLPAEEAVPAEEAAPGGESDAPADDYGDIGRMPHGQEIIQSVFPDAVVTESLRDPNSRLGRANPGSAHNSTENAVDVRPIPGVTFDQFIQRLRDEGHDIIEAIDEVNHPSRHATGPHWHVVFAG